MLRPAYLRVFRNGQEMTIDQSESYTTDWLCNPIDGPNVTSINGLYFLIGRFETINAEPMSPGENLTIEHLDFRQEIDIMVTDIVYRVDLTNNFQLCSFQSNGVPRELVDEPIIVDKVDDTNST